MVFAKRIIRFQTITRCRPHFSLVKGGKSSEGEVRSGQVRSLQVVCCRLTDSSEEEGDKDGSRDLSVIIILPVW